MFTSAHLEKEVINLKAILTVEGIEKLAVDSKTKNVYRRILYAANRLGLQLIIAADKDYTNLYLGWPDKSGAPGEFKTSIALTRCRDPLRLTASVLELVGHMFNQTNSTGSGLNAAVEQRLEMVERRLGVQELLCQEYNDMCDKMRQTQQTKSEERKQRKAEIDKVVAELNKRAKKIRGEVYCLDDSNTVHYHRWRLLLKCTVPAKFRKRVRGTRMDFILWQDENDLRQMIKHDEAIFPKRLAQVEQTKQRKESTKKTPE